MGLIKLIQRLLGRRFEEEEFYENQIKLCELHQKRFEVARSICNKNFPTWSDEVMGLDCLLHYYANVNQRFFYLKMIAIDPKSQHVPDYQNGANRAFSEGMQCLVRYKKYQLPLDTWFKNAGITFEADFSLLNVTYAKPSKRY